MTQQRPAKASAHEKVQILFTRNDVVTEFLQRGQHGGCIVLGLHFVEHRVSKKLQARAARREKETDEDRPGEK